MTFDPIKFLGLASDLFDDTNYDEEERYRTCISRAYYATHLFTREKLKKLGFVVETGIDKRKGDIHQIVIDALKGVKEEDKIVWRGKKEKKLWEMITKIKKLIDILTEIGKIVSNMEVSPSELAI